MGVLTFLKCTNDTKSHNASFGSQNVINHLRNSKQWFTDDTFKMWPEVFLQLQSWISR